MANKRRGEVDVVFDGQTYRMCLTLGALAELEAAFGEEDMLALASRFEHGCLKSDDAIRIIGAGLRGAGHDVRDQDVAHMQCDAGAAGFVVAVAELLQATFGGPSNATAEIVATSDNDRVAAPGEERRPAPFPGTM